VGFKNRGAPAGRYGRGPALRLNPRMGPAERIAGSPPRTVGELADALGIGLEGLLAGGPLPGVLPPHPRFSAAFEWDVHHEPPVATAQALAARRLRSYSAHVPGIEEALARVHGAPEHSGGKRRYGPFFFTGQHALEWYAETPDWALEPVDLARALASGATELTFRPPVPARELTAALGAPGAEARTVDVHMSHWEIALPTAVATLAAAPVGPAYSVPAGLAAKLSHADRVRHIRFTAPR